MVTWVFPSNMYWLATVQKLIIKDDETKINLLSTFTSMEEPVFIHPTAIIEENVQMGSGTKVWCFSHILKNSTLGSGCVLGQNVAIGPNVVLGNNVKVQNNVSVYEGVQCEDDVFIGPSVVFTNVINPRSFINRKDEFRTTIVRRGASIGANATILCGITIGEYAMIGAGAVVTKDVPDYNLVVGNPGRIVGRVDKEGNKL